MKKETNRQIVFSGSLPIAPVSWSRPRKAGHSRTGFFNTAKLTQFYKDLKSLCRKEKCHSGNLSLTVDFYLKKPKTTKNAYPTKADLSNYIKAVEDGLNGVLWIDDRYIVELHSKKAWTDNVSCIVIVLEKLL